MERHVLEMRPHPVVGLPVRPYPTMAFDASEDIAPAEGERVLDGHFHPVSVPLRLADVSHGINAPKWPRCRIEFVAPPRRGLVRPAP